MKYVYSKLGVNVDLCCGGWQQSSSLSSIIGLGHRGKELFVLFTISYNDVHDSPNVEVVHVTLSFLITCVNASALTSRFTRNVQSYLSVKVPWKFMHSENVIFNFFILSFFQNTSNDKNSHMLSYHQKCANLNPSQMPLKADLENNLIQVLI